MEKRNRQTAYKQAYNEKAYARLAITIPKAREEAVKAHAKSKGESVNGLVNALLRADMGLSDADWKRTEAEEGAEVNEH